LDDSNRFLISFCIPTYNRAELAKNAVLKITEIDSKQIEIVVINNNSPDNTEENIRSIVDPRISYYRNSTNIGGVMNIIETIKKARGEWVFLLSDEDTVHKGNLEILIKELATQDFSGVAVMMGNVLNFNGRYSPECKRYKNATYLKGDEAISNAGFSHHYMSGLMINKKHIDQDQLNRFTFADGMYPHTNIYTRACMSGSVITKDVVFCTAGSYEGHKNPLRNEEYYFHPVKRLELFKIFAKMAYEIIERPNLKVSVLARLYFEYLSLSTYGWERVLKTESIRTHFGVDKDTKFDFWVEFNKFNSNAMGFLKEIVVEPAVAKDLDVAISKRMSRFKRNAKLRPILDPLKRIVRPLYFKLKKA
jgi:glycosyltransferase involved in cell wall biosynthesis